MNNIFIQKGLVLTIVMLVMGTSSISLGSGNINDSLSLEQILHQSHKELKSNIEPFLLYGVRTRIAPWGDTFPSGRYTSVARRIPSLISTINVSRVKSGSIFDFNSLCD
jgi:hypothetical protein